MTVKQLIQQLSSYPEDAQVLIAQDEEWNSIHYMDELDPIIRAYYKDEDVAGRAIVLTPNHATVEVLPVETNTIVDNYNKRKQ